MKKLLFRPEGVQQLRGLTSSFLRLKSFYILQWQNIGKRLIIVTLSRMVSGRMAQRLFKVLYLLKIFCLVNKKVKLHYSALF